MRMWEKNINALQVYETTLVKGIGEKGADLCRSASEWKLCYGGQQELLLKHTTPADNVVFDKGMG